MKKVLILAYDFPPYNSIGGQRPYSWYKYLKEFGWEPIVVTRHWDEDIKNPIDCIKPSKNKEVVKEITEYGTLIRVPFKPNLRDKMLLKYGFSMFSFIRKFLTLVFQLGEFCISFLDNKSPIYRAANDYLKDNTIDAIIATGEPFILFKYASKLSKKYNIPWIADYRDGWSTNYNQGKWLRVFKKSKEKHILNNVSKVTSVSKPLANDIHNAINKSVHVIFNGFNSEDLIINRKQATDKFIVSYAGNIYPYQRLEVFLDGLKKFLIGKEDFVSCNFYGLKFYPEQEQRLIAYSSDIESNIHITDRLPHHEVKLLMRKSHVLLVLANEEIDGSCAKIFDYFAAKRKILCVVNDHGTLQEQILDTESGILTENSEEVTKVLEATYNEWKNTGCVSCKSKKIENFSREEQTGKLAKLLAKIGNY